MELFPKQIDDEFRGSRVIVWVFALVTLMTLARSCIHLFAPDGGAWSIAGIDLSVTGGGNIVSLFALWGLSQLIIGFVFLVVLLRYKSLIPFMYLLILIEYTGRIMIGYAKPLAVTHVPPGAIGDYVMVPLAILMLILSFRSHQGKT
jgi:hypothetical protein